MTSMIDKYDSITKLYGIQNYSKIKESKILIVGAGGIGCEVTAVYRCKMIMIKARLLIDFYLH